MNWKLFLVTGLFVFKGVWPDVVFAQSGTNERAKWFIDDRFGMFIHWGVYSGAEGFWKGEKIRNDNDYAEWIFYRNRINKGEYLELLHRFDWDSIVPEEWVLLAKRSGMKYVTLTAKHHDGFALWNSKVSDYDVADHTQPSRDIVLELAEACRKHGLKLGLYYSHWVDWEHPYGWDHTREIDPITSEEYDIYWQEKVIPQMRELLTNYGPIGILWFDMWIDHSQTIVTKDQLLQLKALIRDLQPDCLVNSRLGLSLEEDPDIDFRTLGDNQIGREKLEYPWQSPATVAHSWGFHRQDTEWKSTSTLLKSLINNVSLNGNLMLNIGPRANGEVPYEIQERMLEMGEWLVENGESIYGAGAFDLPKDQHDWGRITAKHNPGGKYTLYLHIYNWPLERKLYLTGIAEMPDLIYSLSDKGKKSIPFDFYKGYMTIDLSGSESSRFVSVIAVEYPRKPEIIEGLSAKTLDGGYSLLPGNRLYEEGIASIVPKDKRGTVPSHLRIDGQYGSQWKIYVEKPMELAVDLSYSCQVNDPAGNISVTMAGETLSHLVKHTGLTVGEPNQNWHIENFQSHQLGSILIEKPGIYDIDLRISSGQDAPVLFQWIWLEEMK